jgi:methyl-accepting chemotaxis protein
MKKAINNMKIARKLTLGFLLITLFSLIIGAAGVFSILQLKKAGDRLYQSNTLGLSLIGQAAGEFQMLRYSALETTTLTSYRESTESIKALTALNESVSAKIDEFALTLDESHHETIELFNTTKENWEIYKGFMRKATIFVDQNNNDFAYDVIKVESKEAGDILWDNFTQLMALCAEDAKGSADSNNTLALIMISVIGVVFIIGAALSIITSKFFASLISKPLEQMARAADKLAIGDLDVHVEVTGNDEVGMLARSFGAVVESNRNQALAAEKIASGDLTIDVEVRSDMDLLGQKMSDLVRDLNKLLTGIAVSADQVASGASQVSDSSMALSQGAAEQASSVEELTASLDQVSVQTNRNAENANNAKKLAENAKEIASNGNEKMYEMLKAMDDINQSSKSINKVIKVIDDIAFQTSILALNAAVEAARAGAAGKGFSVVAEEVKNLAQKSAEAANETSLMIEESIGKVHSGTVIAKATAEALGHILEEVDKAANLVSEIASASNEQAAAIEQINRGIMQVSQVVQANSATSEQSASASEELSGQARMLTEMIGQFKLKNEEVNQEKETDELDFPELSEDDFLELTDDDIEDILVGSELGKYN